MAKPIAIVTPLGHAVSQASDAAVKLRMAIEESIFGNRSWLRRGSYYVWSKARTALRKAEPKK
jgi:hypothetical protein